MLRLTAWFGLTRSGTAKAGLTVGRKDPFEFKPLLVTRGLGFGFVAGLGW